MHHAHSPFSMHIALTALGKLHYGKDGPAYATSGSAGLDLRACLDTPENIAPGERRCVPVGFAMELRSPGLAGFVFSRSGLGAKHGITVAQGVGVIDPDYRGEICVYLLNTSGEPRTIEPGERIAQLVIMPVALPSIAVVEALGETARGAGGFGHTGAT